MIGMKWWIAGAIALGVSTSATLACITEPPPPTPANPPWPTWYTVKSDSPLGDGWVRQQLYINVGLFTAQAQGCACGFGYDGSALASLTNGSVRVFEYTPNLAGGPPAIGGPVAPFDTLASNPITTAFLSSSPPFSGYNWFGFSGIVQNDQPLQGFFAICFQFDLTVADDVALKTRIGCVAGGSADSLGNPLVNDPIHPFGIVNCLPIPAPGAVALLGLAGLASRRRR